MVNGTETLPDADTEGLVTEVGNSGCIVKKKVRGFGPYAYHVVKKNGHQTWTYLGRADRIGLVTKQRVGNSEVGEE